MNWARPFKQCKNYEKRNTFTRVINYIADYVARREISLSYLILFN